MDNVYTSKTADLVLFYFIQNSKKRKESKRHEENAPENGKVV